MNEPTCFARSSIALHNFSCVVLPKPASSESRPLTGDPYGYQAFDDFLEDEGSTDELPNIVGDINDFEAQGKYLKTNCELPNLRDCLARTDAMFEFLVQRWPDLSQMPTWAIENATRTWPARWKRVAIVEIPRQAGIPERDRSAEPMTPMTRLPTFRLSRARRGSGFSGCSRARAARIARAACVASVTDSK